MLESRLDSVIFRSGLAPTIPAARQMVNHGHVRVNDKKVDIASFRMKPGEKVSLRSKMQKHPHGARRVRAPNVRAAQLLGRPTRRSSRSCSSAHQRAMKCSWKSKRTSSSNSTTGSPKTGSMRPAWSGLHWFSLGYLRAG